tara:strand:+ start:254 stop:550 length:297 start_codon:yes stop_codon:yes gene_type:complete
MTNFFQNLSSIEVIFLIIGFSGQAIFGSRFIFQWLYSERLGRSAIPFYFWYLSIFGGLFLLIYAIYRMDPVIIVGQLFGIFIYTRNIYLIKKNDKTYK